MSMRAQVVRWQCRVSDKWFTMFPVLAHDIALLTRFWCYQFTSKHCISALAVWVD